MNQLEEIKQALENLKERSKTDPNVVGNLLRSAGIIDNENNLTEHYRPKEDRKLVGDKICVDNVVMNYTNLDQLIENLINLKNKYSDKQNLDIEFDSGYSNISTYLRFDRLETDKEYKDRTNKTKKDTENKEKSEKKLYEKLKRKYG